jgi:release factor glutamine methyltransferase
LELCAGAGQIGLLTLALSPSPAAQLVAVDSNPIACDFIRQNAQHAGLAERVEVREGDLTTVLDPVDRFDLIVADPPWVEHGRVPDHPGDPVLAIDGGADGLDLATACLQVAEAHLRDGSSLLLQLGSAGQVTEVVRRAETSGSRLGFVEARHFGRAGSLARFVAAER